MARFCDLWNSWLFSTRHPSCRRHRSTSLIAHVAAEVLEARALLSAPHTVSPDNVKLTISGGNVTLSATDSADHIVNISRSGGNVVFTGSNGTQIKFGNNLSTTQTVALASVASLSINPGTGSDQYTVKDLSISGAVNFNGGHSGPPVLSIQSQTTPVVIGGPLNVTVGSPADVQVYGSVTVVGAFNFHELDSGKLSGSVIDSETQAGQEQKFQGGVNIQGNGASNIVEFIPGDGHITIDGGLKVNLPHGSNIVELVSTSGHMTVGGDATITDGPESIIEFINQVTFNGSLTIKGGNLVEFIGTNPNGAPIVNGATKIQLAHVADLVEFISTDLTHTVQLNGTLSITTAGANDVLEFSRAKVTGNVTIKTGGNPTGKPDRITVDGSEFDGTFSATMKGPTASVKLANDHTITAPTLFKQNVTLQMTGASASVQASNSNAGTPLTFLGTLLLHGGNPVGVYATFGAVSFANPGDLILIKFLVAP